MHGGCACSWPPLPALLVDSRHSLPSLREARALAQAAAALHNQTQVITNVTLLYVLVCASGDCLKLNPYASSAAAAAPAVAALAIAAAAMLLALFV